MVKDDDDEEEKNDNHNIQNLPPHVTREERRLDSVGAKLVDRLRQKLLSPTHDDHARTMEP